MIQKVMLLSHVVVSEEGESIHGPVHSVAEYLRLKDIPYRLVELPLYSGFLRQIWNLLKVLVVIARRRWQLYVGFNPVNTFIAIPFRKLKWIGKLIYYSVDYADNRFNNPLKNYLYHWLDRRAAYNSDQIWNVSRTIMQVRKRQGVLQKSLLVPNAPLKMPAERRFEEGSRFLLLVSQAFETDLPSIISIFTHLKISLTVIGASDIYEYHCMGVECLPWLPYQEYLKRLPTFYAGCTFYFDDKPWTWYADSMKARQMLAYGLPVIINDKVGTSEDVSSYNAGYVIHSLDELEKAVKYVVQHHDELKANALKLTEVTNLEKILDKALEFE